MIIAVDVGGTKTLVAAVTNNGVVQKQQRFETPQEYPQFIKKLEDTIAEITTESIDVISVAFPARLDRETGVALSFGNLPWRNIAVVEDIANFSKVPVLLENDAKAAAISEANALTPLPHKALYVTISTGIGAGFVVDGVLDPNLKDMEIGHMTLEFEDKLWGWEEIASGKAISNKFGKKVSEITDPSELFYMAHVIALGLNELIATLTPDIVIIGGGAGSHLDNFKEQLLTELHIMSTDMITIPPVVTAKDGENAVINGCIILAQQKLKG